MTEQREAYIKEEERLLSEHRQKMLKLAKSCGGFFLTGWMAKIGVWSWLFFYVYFCITLIWFVTR